MSYLITVGKGPDFVLRRGGELLNHLCHISLVDSEGGIGIIRTVSHRSLFVVAREVSQIASSHLGIAFCLREPSNKTNSIGIELNVSDRSKTLLVDLCFHVGLPPKSQELIGMKLYGFILKFGDLPIQSS